MQFDAASGNSGPRGHVSKLSIRCSKWPSTLLAGYTPGELVHIKQSRPPADQFSEIRSAVAEQWRETTADAVYTILNIPVPGTAGGLTLYGTYEQADLQWTINPHLVCRRGRLQ